MTASGFFKHPLTTMITAKARHYFLETIPIFAGLNAGALSEIGAAVQEMGFRAGDIIVREGESGNRMFIIHSGRVGSS